MSELPKIAFLIPAYGGVPIPAWQSHINLVANAGRFCHPAFITASSCYVNASRNKLLENFVKADLVNSFDYVFWIDSDIVFNWGDCAKLLDALKSANADVITGVYFNFIGNELVPMLNDYIESEDRYSPSKLTGGTRKVDSAGLGFTIQTAQSLRKMMGDFGKDFFNFRKSKRGTLIGEDNIFFEHAKKSGFQPWVAEDIRAGHAKIGVF